MLPMGTIVTACMIAGLVTALLQSKLPNWLSAIVGWVLLAAGLWNALWYGLQHLTEFWGLAALVSGVVMIITAAYLLCSARVPSVLLKAKPIVLVVLFACAAKYAITIAQL